MTVTVPVTSLERHEARSDLRVLAGSFAQAWDHGDAERVVAHFAPHASWSHLESPRVRGVEALLDTYDHARAAEPWSLHWLTNEDVEVREDGAEGSWQWLALSAIEHGAQLAWSSGDLRMRATPARGGWRIADLEVTTRLRAPVDVGWLHTELVPVVSGPPSAAVPDASGRPVPVCTIDLSTCAPARTGSPERRAAALAAEVEVRRLLPSHLRARDAGGAGLGTWGDDAVLVTAGPTGHDTARGRREIGERLDAELAGVQVLGRFLADQAIVVHGDGARSHATDLWVAVVDGEARWLAHRYVLDAARQGRQWTVQRLTRTRVLDEPYAVPAPQPATAAAAAP